jgi:hypothetical protein
VKYLTRELAARTGVSVDRLHGWREAGHLTPLNPNRPRVQTCRDPWLWGRSAVLAAAVGRLATDADLGPVSVAKIVRYCDRADLERRFAAGQTTVYVHDGTMEIGETDAQIVSHGPIVLAVLGLATLWQEVNRQLDRLEAEEAAEPAPGGNQELVLTPLTKRREEAGG